MKDALNKIQELAIATEVSINQAFPSIYTKENVIVIVQQLVSEIEEILQHVQPAEVKERVQEYTLPVELQDKLIQSVTDNINEEFDQVDSNNLVDFGSAEFEINYGNQIELARIEVDAGAFNRAMINTVSFSIKDFFARPQILAVDQS